MRCWKREQIQSLHKLPGKRKKKPEEWAGDTGEFYFCCEYRNTQIYLEAECTEPVEKMLKMRKEVTGN